MFPADLKNSLEKVTHGLTYLTREVGTNLKHVESLVILLYSSNSDSML